MIFWRVYLKERKRQGCLFDFVSGGNSSFKFYQEPNSKGISAFRDATEETTVVSKTIIKNLMFLTIS